MIYLHLFGAWQGLQLALSIQNSCSCQTGHFSVPGEAEAELWLRMGIWLEFIFGEILVLWRGLTSRAIATGSGGVLRWLRGPDIDCRLHLSLKIKSQSLSFGKDQGTVCSCPLSAKATRFGNLLTKLTGHREEESKLWYMDQHTKIWGDGGYAAVREEKY